MLFALLCRDMRVKQAGAPPSCRRVRGARNQESISGAAVCPGRLGVHTLPLNPAAP
jgi:hypothetical protein